MSKKIYRTEIIQQYFEPNLNLKNNLGRSFISKNSILEIVSSYGLGKVSKFFNE